MHNAPSVSYPVGRPLVAALLAGARWAAGAVATSVWMVGADGPGWRQGLMAGLVIVTGVFALLSWVRSPRGDLHWDGAGWTAPGCIRQGTLEVALDLQLLLLVRWRGDGSSSWLWLERRRCPQRWPDLRRAVYSRANPRARPSARPPTATP